MALTYSGAQPQSRCMSIAPNRSFSVLPLAIREAAETYDMYLTCHAPYYINLNSPEPEKLEASKKRIFDALCMSEIAGIKSVCVHAAFYLGQEPKIALVNVRKAVDDIMKKKAKFFPHVNLGLETMGKPTQFGTLEEVLIISKEFDIYPTVDPAHLHAQPNKRLDVEIDRADHP